MVRSLTVLLFLLCAAGSVSPARSASAKLMKVLPQFLDREGRHAVSPSLYDRDAYQARLRRHPEECSGIRFAIEWKGPKAAPFSLRVELRGAHGQLPTTATLQQSVGRRGLFSAWSSLSLAGDDYKNFGELIAWRATLWDGPRQVAEQKSFLW